MAIMALLRTAVVMLEQTLGVISFLKRFITRITFLVFCGILIGCIILLPPEIVFL